MRRPAQALPSPGPLREAGDRPPCLQSETGEQERLTVRAGSRRTAPERRKSRDAALKKNKILQAHQPRAPQKPKAEPPPAPSGGRGLPLIYPRCFPTVGRDGAGLGWACSSPSSATGGRGLLEAQSISLPAPGPRGDGSGEADSEQVSVVEQLLSIRKFCICNTCGSLTELRKGVHPLHGTWGLKGQRL